MSTEEKKLASVDILPGRRWNAHAALGDAMHRADMAAPMAVMWLEGENQLFRFALANCKNKDLLWMAEMMRLEALGLLK